MANKVRRQIIEEIKTAKYFSIIIDCTPDISHVDQLSFVFHYILNSGKPVERFLQFLPNTDHNAEDLANSVFHILTTNNIDIKNCRGQGYDNALNMSGKYKGFQARIKNACSYAVYIPCSAHSLNLIDECAASCCLTANNFFNLIQNIFTLFSASTNRWQVLSECLTGNISIKRLSDTRWSVRQVQVYPEIGQKF